MGRESNLIRALLGRSALGEPLRDENGELILGAHARAFDDQTYQQQFTDRGHPQNLESDRRNKDFCHSQNEILEICGVVVRKNNDRRRTQGQQDLANAAKVESLCAENSHGFVLALADRCGANLLTWWLMVSRRRLATCATIRTGLLSAIGQNICSSPSRVLFGGYPSWALSTFARVLRKDEVSEPIAHMNYLELKPPHLQQNLEDMFFDYLHRTMTLGTEIILNFISVLDSLDFPVWKCITSAVVNFTVHDWLWSTWIFKLPEPRQLMSCVGLYCVSDRLHEYVGWTLYGIFRQMSIRPGRPSKLSIRAAKDDDLTEETAILGIGRPLASDFPYRFYGPQTWSGVIRSAFPWLARVLGSERERDELKAVALQRCAQMENSTAVPGSPYARITRAQHIIGSLASLGVDIEEDLFVDLDQWSREASFLAADQRASPNDGFTWMLQAPFRLSEPTDADGGPTELMSASNEDPITLEEALQETDGIPAHPRTAWERPTTPEPGLQRAQSLNLPIIRPRRRLTDVEDAQFEGGRADMVARMIRRGPVRKRKSKDQRSFEVTRLTTFPADSLAWHTSSFLTRLLLLPIDAIYWRCLAHWFTKATGMGNGYGIFENNKWQSTADVWRLCRALVLNMCLEGLVRGVIWRFGSYWAIQISG